MNAVVDALPDFQDPIVVTHLAMIAVGLASCFAGYRIFRILTGAFGALAGLAAGVTLAERFGVIDPLASLAIGLVCGLIGFCLAYFLIRVGLFAMGAYGGALLGMTLYSTIGQGPLLLWVWGFAFVSGILLVILNRPLIVAATALNGAMSLVLGILYFTHGFSYEQYVEDPEVAALYVQAHPLYFYGGFALAILGAVAQIQARRRDRK